MDLVWSIEPASFCEWSIEAMTDTVKHATLFFPDVTSPIVFRNLLLHWPC